MEEQGVRSQRLTAEPAVLGKRNKEFEKVFKGMKSVIFQRRA